MAPRAPPTPRSTRNSRGLRNRTEDAGNTPARPTRVVRRPRARPRTPTPPPPSPPPSSPSSVALSAPPSPSAPPRAPEPALAAPSRLPSPLPTPTGISLLSALQGRGQDVWAALRRIEPGRRVPRLPLRSPISYSVESVFLPRPTRRHIPGVGALPKLLSRAEREARLFNSLEEQEGEKFGRELYTAIRNNQFLRRCPCHLPNIYDSKEAAEAPAARGHFRFYVCGENEDQLGVILDTNDFRDSCRCKRDLVLPVYYNILDFPTALNENGKRQAEGSELDLLAESTEQRQPTEVVRIVPAPVDPVPTNRTRRQRMSTYLQRKLNRIRTMGNSVLAMFGRSNDNSAATNTEAVDTRRIDSGNNSLTVKRFKRQACLPADATGPSVDLKELPYLEWAEDVTAYIGADNIRLIRTEFKRQIHCIKSSFVRGGASTKAIVANVKTNEDLDLSLVIHEWMRERVGTFTMYDPVDVQDGIVDQAKTIYLQGLKGITNFMKFAYDHENIAKLHKNIPAPITPLMFGDYEFRNQTRQGADLLLWLVRSGRYPSVNEALSKLIVDAKAIHKQELPPSFVYHPGTDDHPLMPGSFPILVYDEIAMDTVDIDPVHALKHPESEPNPPVKGRDFKVVAQPKGILKKQPKEWPEDPVSPQYVAPEEKRRKLAFGSPAAAYLPPKNIPNKVISVNDAIVDEFLAAQRLGGPSIERADSVLSIVTHTRLGLVSPSNYTAVRQYKPDEEQARGDEERMKLRYHATKYGGLLEKMSRFDLHDKGTETVPQPEPADPSLGNQTIQTEESGEAAKTAVVDEQDHKVSPSLIQDDYLMEQDINPEVPNVAAALNKSRLDRKALLDQRATPQDRQRFLDQFFGRHEDDNADYTIPAGSPLDDSLEISTAKRDEFDVNHQILREIEEAHARQAREKKQRELEAVRRQEEERRQKEEEERRQKEEERRQREEERRQKEELRRKEQEDRKLAAEARRRKEAAQYAAMTGLRAPSRPIINPLSQDWDEKVENVKRVNPSTDLATMLDGNPLRRPDFTDRLLPEKAWLNDNVIIGSILYIADYVNNAAGVNGKLNPKCSALNSYFWPRLQQHGLNSCTRLMRSHGIRKENFLEIDTILIPICENSHWTLGVVCPSRRTVSHVDSMQAGASDPAIANRLLDWVRVTLGNDFIENSWNTITYRSPRQTNGWDCGVFTITNAICLALGVDPTEAYSAKQLTVQRRRLAAILLNGGFKGDFTLDGL